MNVGIKCCSSMFCKERCPCKPEEVGRFLSHIVWPGRYDMLCIPEVCAANQGTGFRDGFQ